MKNQNAKTQAVQFDSTTIEYVILAVSSILVIAVFMAANLFIFDFSGQQYNFGQSTFFNNTTVAQTQVNPAAQDGHIMWRYTSEGWQDVAALIEPQPESSPVLEKVHPLVWTGVIVLGVSMLMVFASNDEDVEELFK